MTIPAAAAVVVPKMTSFFLLGDGSEFHDGRVARTRDSGQSLSADGNIAVGRAVTATLRFIVINETVQLRGSLDEQIRI